MKPGPPECMVPHIPEGNEAPVLCVRPRCPSPSALVPCKCGVHE